MATKEKSDKPNNELIMKLYLGNQKSFGNLMNYYLKLIKIKY